MAATSGATRRHVRWRGGSTRWPRQKRDIEARISGIQEEQAQAAPPDTDQLRRTLESFEPVWEALEPIERSNLARLLIAEVAYDPDTDEIEIGLTAAALRDEEAA